jgi:hypothetical protein
MQNLAHSTALDSHAGEPHDVGPRQTVVVDRLDVLIDDGHGMPGGRQRREQRQARGRKVALLAEQRQCVFEAPVRHFEPRIDQDDIGHSRLLRRVVKRDATPKRRWMQ